MHLGAARGRVCSFRRGGWPRVVEVRQRHTLGRPGSHRPLLPLLANLREKPSAGRAFLAQYFIAAVAVVADRRPANKNLWFLFRPRQSLRQIHCPGYAAVANLRFLGRGPPSENAFARQVNHGVESGYRLGRNRRRRVPRDLAFTRSRASHQPYYGTSTRFEGGKKRGPNRPGNPADKDSGIHDLQIVTLPVHRASEQTGDRFEIFERPEMAESRELSSQVLVPWHYQRRG